MHITCFLNETSNDICCVRSRQQTNKKFEKINNGKLYVSTDIIININEFKSNCPTNHRHYKFI